MDFSHYTDGTVQTAVDLVNSLDASDGAEHLATRDDLDKFLASHGREFRPERFHAAEKDLHEVRAIRSELRLVFEAETEAEAADVINAILTNVVATPRVSVHGDGPHLHFEPQHASPARWLGAVTGMALAVALVEGGIDRFGICGSTTCHDVFVDSSRNRSRLHCSDRCTTRESVAAYRQRQQAG